MSPALKNFHLPLPREIYERLKEEAARESRPATAVAREAIEGWLDERRKLTRREEIAEYAAREAGSRFDLDPHLEKAALEHLAGKSAKGKKR